MRVLLISDSHGRNVNMERIIRKIMPDYIIHLGDLEGSEGYLEAIAPCPIEMVCGNCDFFSKLPKAKVITLGKYKALITHGHLLGVNYGYDQLVKAAKQYGCQIAIFGHIHRPVYEVIDGVTVINPGSISQPRQDNKKASYAVMDIDRRGEFYVSIEYTENIRK